MRDGLAGFEVEERDGVVIAAISGEIDSSNATDLRLAISEKLPSAATALVIDLTATEYLDSSGIQLLFELGRRLSARRQRMRLVVPESAPMRRVLELTAVEGVAPMDPDLKTALRELSTGAI